jgi:predicted nuclease with TOPRIM domain
VSDARRLEVYEQARAHWGDGPAETLMEIDSLEARFDALEARMTKLDERLTKLEERFAVLEERTSHLATRSFVLASQVPLYLLVVGLYFTG